VNNPFVAILRPKILSETNNKNELCKTKFKPQKYK
jgi:hypothetical protein